MWTPTLDVQNCLRNKYVFDPDSGIVSHARTGKEAGGPTDAGYRHIRVIVPEHGVNTLVKTHRLAWFLYHGTWPTEEIDHRDNDGQNNRIDNLRLATRQQNVRNVRKQAMYDGVPTTSGFKGVHWAKREGKWQARIVVDRKQIHLGTFDDETEAAEAYRVASCRYFGEFVPDGSVASSRG